MSDEIVKVDYKIDILNARLEICKGLVKSCENLIAEERRNKWWLEHPTISYFTARTTWQTNYGHSEWNQELCFYVNSVVGLDNSSMDYQNRDWFANYPALEKEVVDDYDGEFTTYTNPYLCT